MSSNRAVVYFLLQMAELLSLISDLGLIESNNVAFHKCVNLLNVHKGHM